MNLLEEVSGKMPQDQSRMLAAIQAYLDLPDTDRIIYRVGRRGGAYRTTDDLKADPATYRKIKKLVTELKKESGEEAVEKFITEMVDRYI